MKKNSWIAVIVCIVIAGAIAIISSNISGCRPYKDLDAADIISASVELFPPDKTIEIIEIRELVEYLQDIVIYKEDNSYKEYAGQAVVFTLTMADGSEEKITAYNPFVVINGTGYRTEYEPCEKLNSYANKLLNEAQVSDAATKAAIKSFSLTFDTNGISSYDSSSGKLVKTNHATHPEDYITTMFLSEEQWQEVTELLGSLALLGYPDNYDPINDPNSDTITSSQPSMTLILTVKTDRWTKTVTCGNIAYMFTGYNDAAQDFLDVCKRLQEIITSTEEWKALPEYEYFYL